MDKDDLVKLQLTTRIWATIDMMKGTSMRKGAAYTTNELIKLLEDCGEAADALSRSRDEPLFRGGERPSK
jgi:hypothetical protein